MNPAQHLAEGKRLLEKATEVSRRPKESEQDRKNDQVICMDLLDFARVHFAAAQAEATVHLADVMLERAK